MSQEGTGRNDPCPCGSGRKYKHCCWRVQRYGDISRPALYGDGDSLRGAPTLTPPSSQTQYTFKDAAGRGEIFYNFERGRRFVLTNGQVVDIEHLAIGMRFHLDGGMVATVTKVDQAKVWPVRPLRQDAAGRTLKRVLGKVKYTGLYAVMVLTVGDLKIRTTPGNRYYSVTRQAWVEAGSVFVGSISAMGKAILSPWPGSAAPNPTDRVVQYRSGGSPYLLYRAEQQNQRLGAQRAGDGRWVWHSQAGSGRIGEDRNCRPSGVERGSEVPSWV